jgi:hypothetical protein
MDFFYVCLFPNEFATTGYKIFFRSKGLHMQLCRRIHTVRRCTADAAFPPACGLPVPPGCSDGSAAKQAAACVSLIPWS